MLKSEFTEILREVSPTHRDPTPEEYERIEDVYTYHPAIGDKKTIVKLWAEFGNVIIDDMMPRTEAIRNTERDLFEARNRYDRTKKEYDDAMTEYERLSLLYDELTLNEH